MNSSHSPKNLTSQLPLYVLCLCSSLVILYTHKHKHKHKMYSLPLSLNPSLLFHRLQTQTLPSDTNLFPFPIISKPSSFHSLSKSKSHVCFTFSPSGNNNSSNYEQEEARWLREEQRWLREEQRWLREEQRWTADRESLLNQIADLKLQVQDLERRISVQGASSVPETVANVAALLQLLKKEGDLGKSFNQIADGGSSAVPFELEAVTAPMVVKDVIRVSENEVREVKKERITLRKGAEGDEVRSMQEALQRLGFYSGEEDMEHAYFSSGTERAVKTWQSSLGAPENGIMTSELLERLYVEEKVGAPGFQLNADAKGNDGTAKDGANGAAFASVIEASEFQQRVVKEEGVAEVEASHHRVFLLGENRWEDSSRLTGRNKPGGQANSKDATTKCLSCRGEGRLLCTECDGTGEPNIEEQFMEWVEEGMKCPYCGGHGYTICDACEGISA